jgi:hypothetical protein
MTKQKEWQARQMKQLLKTMIDRETDETVTLNNDRQRDRRNSYFKQ